MTNEQLQHLETLLALSSPGQWSYIGDVAVSVACECRCKRTDDCLDGVHADLADGEIVVTVDVPHEQHNVVPCLFSNDVEQAGPAIGMLSHEQYQHDCRLIAAAHNALPELIAEVRRFRGMLADFGEWLP